MEINEKMLEKLIRKVLAEYVGGAANGIVKDIEEKSGVLAIKTSTVKPVKFDTGKEGDNVYLTDVFSLDESPRLGCGVMEMKESTFDWTLNYDEVDYIIDGTLKIIINGKEIVGNKSDIILIPKNTSVQFSAPDHARFMYVVYPANWSEQ